MKLKNIFFGILIAIFSLGVINAQNSKKEIQRLDHSDLEIIDGYTEDQIQIMTRELGESYPFKNLLPLQENIDWILYFKSLDIGFFEKELEVLKTFMETRLTINVLNTNEQTTFNTNAASKENLIGIGSVTLGIIDDTSMEGVLPEEFLKTVFDKSDFTGMLNPSTNPKNIENQKTLYNLNSAFTDKGYSVEDALKIWGL